MQALCDEILQRIIHKPMPRHAGSPANSGRGDPDAEMGAIAAAIGPRMARMGGAFVEYFELGRRKESAQPRAARPRP